MLNYWQFLLSYWHLLLSYWQLVLSYWYSYTPLYRPTMYTSGSQRGRYRPLGVAEDVWGFAGVKLGIWGSLRDFWGSLGQSSLLKKNRNLRSYLWKRKHTKQQWINRIVFSSFQYPIGQICILYSTHRHSFINYSLFILINFGNIFPLLKYCLRMSMVLSKF